MTRDRERLLELLAAAAATALMLLAGRHWAETALTAGGTLAATVAFFNQVIHREP